MAEEQKQTSDHDLLITLNVRVQDLIETIKSMDSTLSRDIGGLKEGKLDKSIYSAHCAEDEKDFEYIKKEFETVWKKHDTHENDIKSLNRFFWGAMGIIAAIQFAMPFIVKLIYK
jgi:hypothetical protein